MESFDTQDWGDYLSQMPEVNFEVYIKRKVHLFTLDAELASKLTAIAKSRKVSSQILINTWLREKITEQV